MRFHRGSDQISPSNYPHRYSDLIEQQSLIGWDQLYKARWSQQWSTSQEQYNTVCPTTTKKITGHQWVLVLSRTLIDQWLELWEIRNKERHGRDVHEAKLIRTRTVFAKLQELYTYRNKVCPIDRCLFYNTIEDHLQRHPTAEKWEEWITINKDAIHASAGQARNLGIHRNRTLLDYPIFNPIPNQAPGAW